MDSLGFLDGGAAAPVRIMLNQRHTLSLLSTVLGILLFMGGVATMVAVPASAAAQNTESRISTLLEEAKEEYDMLLFDEAEALLREGIDLVERDGIRSNTAAQLYILLGIVRHASQDESLAEDAFVQAVENYPDVEIHAHYRTPAISDLMTQARRKANPPPFEDDAVAAADDEDLEDMVHDPVRRTRSGQSVVFEAQIPEDLPVFRVYIYHRRFGDDEFVQDEMLPTDAINFAFTLPSAQVRTTQVEYYISAINRSGDAIAEAGRRSNPFRVSVLGATDDLDDSGPALRDPDLDHPEDPGRDREPRANSGFFGFLALGTDVGFLPGGTPPTANDHRSVSPGLAPAFAHSFLNLGWRISELNNIGLYFRWQFSPPQDFASLPEGRIDQNASFWQHEKECFGLGLPGDCLLGLKYERVISTGTPEFYTSVGMGIGRVRNWLRLKQATSEDNPNPICATREVINDPNVGQFCYVRDTVRTGWGHFGIGGGIYYPIHDNFDLVGDSYLMVLIPDTSVNLDINIGIRFRL